VNGLDSKSSAPSFIASTTVGTWPVPVMKTAGTSLPECRISRSSARPSTSGMRMSTSTQIGGATSSSSR